jgi:hypothetical protein
LPYIIEPPRAIRAVRPIAVLAEIGICHGRLIPRYRRPQTLVLRGGTESNEGAELEIVRAVHRPLVDIHVDGGDRAVEGLDMKEGGKEQCQGNNRGQGIHRCQYRLDC